MRLLVLWHTYSIITDVCLAMSESRRVISNATRSLQVMDLFASGSIQQKNHCSLQLSSAPQLQKSVGLGLLQYNWVDVLCVLADGLRTYVLPGSLSYPVSLSLELAVVAVLAYVNLWCANVPWKIAGVVHVANGSSSCCTTSTKWCR